MFRGRWRRAARSRSARPRSTSRSICPSPSRCCRCGSPGRRRPRRRQARGHVVRLDLQLDTPGQIFVRGRGVDAVLGGGLHVGGTTAAPQVSGGFNMRRGTFSLAGTTLTFTRGKVGFDGAGVTNKIDPSLDFEADSPTAAGHGDADRQRLCQRAQDHPVLLAASCRRTRYWRSCCLDAARRSWGRSSMRRSPPRWPICPAPPAARPTRWRASARGLGLDRLSVGGGQAGGSGGSSAATIEAGKYVANGVYVGAKQGTTGANTQATVQIDIYKGSEGGDRRRHRLGRQQRRVDLPVRVLGRHVIASRFLSGVATQVPVTSSVTRVAPGLPRRKRASQ